MSLRLAGDGRRWVRFACRLAGFSAMVAWAWLEYGPRVRLAAPAQRLSAQAQWLGRCSRRLLRVLSVEVVPLGEPPAAGLLVSNHLSYLDILVLASVCPCCFIAKSEVAHWPLFGTLARRAGTLFVRRDQRTDVGQLNAQVVQRLAGGQVVALFPEGTSTDGHQVLRFHSALLAPALRTGQPVTPACIGYRLADGVIEDEVCYWRDMVFLPHLLNLFTKKHIRAVVAFGPSQPSGADRKELARRLHAQVVGLSAQARRQL